MSTKKRGGKKRGKRSRAAAQQVITGRPNRAQIERAARADRALIVRLDGELLGYCMHPTRLDDCFRAATATALQVPIAQVPDSKLDARQRAGEDPEVISRDAWLRFAEWLDGRGLRLVYHEQVPAQRERWVGVCCGSTRPTATDEARLRALGYDHDWDADAFTDHSLVMTHDRLLFDPAIGVWTPQGMSLRRWRPSEISYGISFDAEE